MDSDPAPDLAFDLAPGLGDELLLDGAPWRVVDVAPALALAEMAAAVLDDEGIEVALFAVDPPSGALSFPDDADPIAPAIVLVPRAAEADARALLADAIEDFAGDDAERLLAELAATGVDAAALGFDPALVAAFAERRAADASAAPDDASTAAAGDPAGDGAGDRAGGSADPSPSDER